MALRLQDSEAVSLALSQGASASAINEENESALCMAAGLGDCDSVKRLLDAGASVHHRNDYGFDALGSALWCAHLETAQLLADRGAEVGLEHAAALGRHPQAVSPGARCTVVLNVDGEFVVPILAQHVVPDSSIALVVEYLGATWETIILSCFLDAIVQLGSCHCNLVEAKKITAPLAFVK